MMSIRKCHFLDVFLPECQEHSYNFNQGLLNKFSFFLFVVKTSFNLFILLFEFFLNFNTFLKVNNNLFRLFLVLLFRMSQLVLIIIDRFEQFILNDRNFMFNFLVLFDHTLGQKVVIVIVLFVKVLNDGFGFS